VLLVTPAEIPVNARPLLPARVRTGVERLAAEPEIAQRAEDPRIAIQELRGPQASGYYFNVTDKTWTKAAADDLDAALDMLRSARHAP